MPTKEQIASVLAQIEQLEADQSLRPAWQDMTTPERYAALGEIEWAGFTRKDEVHVIGRVMAGEPPELWMEGVGEQKAKATPGEAEKLRMLEAEMDWTGIDHRDKEQILLRTVDFSKITRDELNAVYDRIGSDDIDERPARRLFDEANYAKTVAEAAKAPFAEQIAGARDSTRDLIGSIQLDNRPRIGAIVDFGIDTQEHYEALYYPIRNDEIAPSVLDAAMGNGAKLTELVQAAPSNPHKDIQFHTTWDDLLGRERPERDGPRYDPEAAASRGSKPRDRDRGGPER